MNSMDNQNYNYRSDSLYRHSYRDRDRDQREDSPPRGRVSNYLSNRDFSPVRPSNRSPLQERIDRYSPDLQHKRLYRSSDETTQLHGRVRTKADYPAAVSVARVRPMIQRSFPDIHYLSSGEVRQQAYAKELDEFEETVPYSNNLSHEDFRNIIKLVKNFEIAMKYFEDMKTNRLEPSPEIYQELVKKAVNEDKNEEAEKLAREASTKFGVNVFVNLVETLVAEDKPHQAFKMLKKSGGLNQLHTLLTAAERAGKRLPEFVLENLMQLCRHKGDQPANLVAANALYIYTLRNNITASKSFYIKLADVYYERGEIKKATEFFNHFIGFQIARENNKDKIDLHGLTPRVGMILIREYLNNKKDNSPFYLVTGQGHHSAQGVQFIMRDFILANFGFISENWLPEVIPDNPGRLLVKPSKS